MHPLAHLFPALSTLEHACPYPAPALPLLYLCHARVNLECLFSHGHRRPTDVDNLFCRREGEQESRTRRSKASHQQAGPTAHHSSRERSERAGVECRFEPPLGKVWEMLVTMARPRGTPRTLGQVCLFRVPVRTGAGRPAAQWARAPPTEDARPHHHYHTTTTTAIITTTTTAITPTTTTTTSSS
ncbi:hypothetical protein O3P69_020023 [Scylla paramamosain]|uniref:Uncharacterized protein n=1 Tax=Scylla paramamosain TaxID=85552 RepID=A0AAW0TN70_SCYPA